MTATHPSATASRLARHLTTSLPTGASTLLTLLALFLALPAPSLAAQDCEFDTDEMDDIQRMRRCVEAGVTWGSNPYGRTMLHFAAANSSNPAVLSVLLDAGYDPNAKGDDGRTPLHLAAYNDNAIVSSVLLDAGAQPNARTNGGWTPLYMAALSGNRLTVSILLDGGADPNLRNYDEEGFFPLHQAAVQDDPILVSTLLDAGADPNATANDGETPLRNALLYSADPSVVSILLDAGADEHLTPLQLSVLGRDTTGVNWLLDNGADPNETDPYGWGPLHFAVPHAGPEVVSTLLAAGADPDIQTSSGATALHVAVRQAPGSVVSALLAAGADPDIRTHSGQTALHVAVWYAPESVVSALLAAGADPNAREADEYALSPLDIAVGLRQQVLLAAPVVQALLEAGADPTARDQDGSTPLHSGAVQAAFGAAEYSADIVLAIELLLNAGADVRAENESGARPMSLLDPHDEAFWLLVVAEGTLEPGRTVTGSLNQDDDRLNDDDNRWDDDWHYYDVWTMTAAVVGQRVVIDMESDDLDAYLRVFRQDGTLVETDDDGGSGSNARVEFRAVYAGDYFVLATSFGERETGGYRVRVR